MRLAGLALVAAACSGPSAERTVEPTLAPEAQADPMASWRALKIRGRDYVEKLAAIPQEQRRAMAITFLRDGDFACRPVTMALPCGASEDRLPAVLPSNDLTDGCLRRKIALWALDQLDGGTIATELADVARKLASMSPPEVEIPRRVIEKVETPALLAELIGLANVAGHEELADQAVARVAADDLEELAFEHGVDAAFEGWIRDEHEELARKEWKYLLTRHPLRRDTGLRVIEYLRTNEGTELDPMVVYTLSKDCVTYMAGKDLFERAAEKRSLEVRGSWQRNACVLLRSEGASSPELRKLISPQGLRVEIYKDHPNDDDEDRVWHDHRKNNASFKMPFADELTDVLADCNREECVVPGTTVRFKLQFSEDGKKLEAIERYERLGGC